MSPIEALNNHLKSCFPCRANAIIIEFEELPNEYKVEFSYYEKDKHYILYCEPCKVYKILPEKVQL